MVDVMAIIGKMNREEYKRRRGIMKYKDVPKIQKNAIEARLKKSIEKYGFDAVRLVHRIYFENVLEKKNLEAEIKEKERELQELKKKG